MENNAAKDISSTETEVMDEEKQFVTFIIGDETYGVDALKVQEIIGMVDITHVPNSLSFMMGVINLRGSVVPAIDMRRKFKMETREYDTTTVIIIVEVKHRPVGMIVDSVSDVLNIAVKEIQEKPHFSANVQVDFIDGIGQKDDTLVIILDTDRILSADELEEIDAKEKEKGKKNENNDNLDGNKNTVKEVQEEEKLESTAEN